MAVMIQIGRVLLAPVAVMMMVACTSTTAFRDRTPAGSNGDCGSVEQPLTLVHDYINPQNKPLEQAASDDLRFDEARAKPMPPSPTAAIDTLLRCSYQRHRNGVLEYDVGFLELDEAGAPRTDSSGVEIDQWGTILKAIERHRKLTVVTYVHGWRHDASIGDEDVRKFHTLLAFTARYMRERDPENRVLGVYIGWRGALVAEPKSSPIGITWSWWTIFNRKPQSDTLAPKVAEYVLALDQAVRQDPKAPAQDRHLLIYGHSLGGNILLQGLLPVLETRLAETAPAQPIRGVGDLVVLINPASEARHMARLQQAVRRYVGIGEAHLNANSYLERNECSKASDRLAHTECAASGSHRTLVSGRPPLLISLTASEYFNSIIDHDPKRKAKCEREEKEPEDCQSKHAADWATGWLFPIMKRVVTVGGDDPVSDLDLRAVGHLLPMRGLNEMHAHKDIAVFGVSHELEIDYGANIASSFGLAGSRLSSVACPRESHFMQWQETAVEASAEKAKRNAVPAFGRLWDTQITLPSVTHSPKRIRLNVKHGAARQHCTETELTDKRATVCQALADDYSSGGYAKQPIQIPALGHAWEPVWNVGTHSNAIASHGGYVSHAVWCFLNRMALDR